MSYIKTTVAEFIDLSASERNGNLFFDDKILAKAGLLMALHEIRVKYQEAFVEAQGKQYGELLDRHDELVLEHRRLNAIYDEAKANKFAIIQRLNEAASAANLASASYNGLRESLQDQSGAYETRVERAEKADRLEKLRANSEAAVLFHSSIISELHSNEIRLAEAVEKLNAATIKVVEAKRALDVFLGKKGVNSPNGLAIS